MSLTVEETLVSFKKGSCALTIWPYHSTYLSEINENICMPTETLVQGFKATVFIVETTKMFFDRQGDKQM